MKKIALIVVLFMLIPFSELHAQDEALSLEGALREAFVRNPDMREARQEIEAAKGRHFQAEMLPPVEAGIEIGSLSQRPGGERKGNVDSFFVEQPLDVFGTRFLKGRIAKGRVNIARHTFRQMWFEVRRQVIELYFRVLWLEKAQDIARQNLDVTRQFLTRVDSRYQAGSGLLSEVLRAKIEVARSENEVLVSEKNLKIAHAQINVTLGKPAAGSLSLSEDLGYEALKYRYNEVRENALAKRSDIQIESLRLKEKGKELTSAWLQTLLPKMSVGVERTMEDYEMDTSIMLKAAYPIWGLNLGEVKAAHAEKEKQKVRFEAVKREADLDVMQSYLEAELADRQVLIQKKSLDEGNELLRQVSLQYEGGELSFLAYLEHIKTIKETRLAYYEALKNYHEKIARLEQALENIPLPEGEKE
jgi:outer membrane protein TolC